MGSFLEGERVGAGATWVYSLTGPCTLSRLWPEIWLCPVRAPRGQTPLGLWEPLFLPEAEILGVGGHCGSVSVLALRYKALQTEGLNRQTLLLLIWRPEV